MNTPITPHLLLMAYARGIFPMTHDDGNIYWYDPDPRAIIPLDAFHVSRSLRRRVRQKPYDMRVDGDFRATMRACAEPAPGRESTWISEDMIDLYTALHQMGHAHSVEAWRDGEMVGGLYGVSIGGLFAGESMFSRATDASKVALVHLVERMRAGGYTLLDTQFVTEHLERFGAMNIPRADYQQRLADALKVRANFFPPGFDL
jgi:leucyl/phenylalanyl-tRNA--protein transferase